MLTIENRSDEKKRIDALINENRVLHLDLSNQKTQNEKLMADLKKARHDRDRYAKRIRFEQGRHGILAKAYHSVCQRNKQLEALLSLAKGVIDGIKCLSKEWSDESHDD